MDTQAGLPHSLLCGLSDYVAAHIGLNFPEERWADLERGIVAAARESGLADVQGFAGRLLSAAPSLSQMEVLASHLTVGETYFFREERSLEILERHILPELLRRRRDTGQHLCIWSAGCCTGEEPYSIAMLLDRLIPDADTCKITILATDVNPRFLQKAAEGVYSDWSFRATPRWARERYFTTRRDGRLALDARIRDKVKFSRLNLADDVYPSPAGDPHSMDVIFCRNVLMYFNADRAKRVAANFYRSLADGGWLVVSATETSNSLFSAFSAVEFPGAVIYRKVAGAGLPDPLPAPEPGEMHFPMPLLESAQAPENEERKPATPACVSARSCANEGRLDEAIEWCAKAIAADKLNPAHRYLLATIRQEQGQVDAAAESLASALYLDPGFVLAQFALANLHLSQGRQREAERHFANALATLRTHPPGEMLPESDGLTAARLVEIITSVLAHQPRVEVAHT